MWQPIGVAYCAAMLVARVLIGLVGTVVVVTTVGSALRTVVLPRAATSIHGRVVFGGLRRLVFDPLARPQRSFETRDRIMAMYAPVALILLPAAWVLCTIVGFACLDWAFGVYPWTEALVTSGSSLLTLGFVRPRSTGLVVMGFVEAVIGLGLISLLISYLPSIYGSFSRREALVARFEARAGLPPSPAVLLRRYHTIGFLPQITEELFPVWEQWFVEVEESHASLPALVFFRSPQPERSWITAAGCVLDSASLVNAVVDLPHHGGTDLLIRTGFLSLRRVADGFGIRYPDAPRPDDPISISRQEFDDLCEELAAGGVPLRGDRDQAWKDFAGWRVNYDAALLGLCDLVMAPPARWSSDRAGRRVNGSGRS